MLPSKAARRQIRQPLIQQEFAQLADIGIKTNSSQKIMNLLRTTLDPYSKSKQIHFEGGGDQG